jgi:hypothetical protein
MKKLLVFSALLFLATAAATVLLGRTYVSAATLQITNVLLNDTEATNYNYNPTPPFTGVPSGNKGYLTVGTGEFNQYSLVVSVSSPSSSIDVIMRNGSICGSNANRSPGSFTPVDSPDGGTNPTTTFALSSRFDPIVNDATNFQVKSLGRDCANLDSPVWTMTNLQPLNDEPGRYGGFIYIHLNSDGSQQNSFNIDATTPGAKVGYISEIYNRTQANAANIPILQFAGITAQVGINITNTDLPQYAYTNFDVGMSEPCAGTKSDISTHIGFYDIDDPSGASTEPPGATGRYWQGTATFPTAKFVILQSLKGSGVWSVAQDGAGNYENYDLNGAGSGRSSEKVITVGPFQYNYDYIFEVQNIYRANALQFSIKDPVSLTTSDFNVSCANQPVGYADSCTVSGQNTIIKGWAYDGDAATNDGRPQVSVNVGGTVKTVNSDVGGYRSAPINSFLDGKGYAGGAARDQQYGWTATFTGLTSGNSYGISGTIVNVGPGSDSPLGLNNSPPGSVDGSPANVFVGNVIPQACIPSPSAPTCTISNVIDWNTGGPVLPGSHIRFDVTTTNIPANHVLGVNGPSADPNHPGDPAWGVKSNYLVSGTQYARGSPSYSGVAAALPVSGSVPVTTTIDDMMFSPNIASDPGTLQQMYAPGAAGSYNFNWSIVDTVNFNWDPQVDCNFTLNVVAGSVTCAIDGSPAGAGKNINAPLGTIFWPNALITSGGPAGATNVTVNYAIDGTGIGSHNTSATYGAPPTRSWPQWPFLGYNGPEGVHNIDAHVTNGALGIDTHCYGSLTITAPPPTVSCGVVDPSSVEPGTNWSGADTITVHFSVDPGGSLKNASLATSIDNQASYQPAGITPGGIIPPGTSAENSTPITPPPSPAAPGTIPIWWQISGGGLAATKTCNGTITVANKPYFKVYGGDVRSCSGSINTWGTSSGRGASGEFGVTAAGTISTFASDGQRFTQINDLTFADVPVTGTLGNFGAGGATCGTNYWLTLRGTPTNLGGSVDLSPTNQQVQYNGNKTLNGQTTGSRLTVFVKGDLTINAAPGQPGVSYTGSWASVAAIPYVTIVTCGDIYIDKGVTTLAGWYIALPRTDCGLGGGGGGTIYSCTNGSNYIGQATLYGDCLNPLTIHGNFTANTIKFLRTRGTVSQSPAIAEDKNSANISESFQSGAETWVAQPVGSTPAPTTGNTKFESITGLPPVL